jgi:uncharacterized membrane protein SpoIIM required for sporulation
LLLKVFSLALENALRFSSTEIMEEALEELSLGRSHPSGPTHMTIEIIKNNITVRLKYFLNTMTVL